MKILRYLLGSLTLLSVIGLIIFLRFYQLGNIPHGINIDEASYGYDAFSLLKTGKDMWGNSWPLTFFSFGDFKPPGLTYLIFLLFKIMPVSLFAVRFPSAIAGIGILFFAWQTLRLLFPKKNFQNFLMIMLLAFSPWAFGISRLFFEVNVGLFFISWQLYLLLQIVLGKGDLSNFIFAGILAGVAGYMQSSLRYVAIANILLVGLIMLFKNPQKKILIKNIFISLSVFLLVQLPVLPQSIGKVGLVRLQQESGKRIEEIVLKVNDYRGTCWVSSNSKILTNICYAFWNKPLLRVEGILLTGLRVISPENLFFHSVDNYIIPSGTGPYVWSLLPLFFVGIWIIIKEKKLWQIFIIGAAMFACAITSTVGELSIHRNVTLYYELFFVIVAGFYYLLPVIGYLIIGITFILNFRYVSEYFLIYTHKQPEVWDYNSPEVMSYVKSVELNYDTIYDNVYFVGPLLYAYDTQYSPELFQSGAIWSKSNIYGNTIPMQVGKYKTSNLTEKEVFCIGTKSLWITLTRSDIPSELAEHIFNDGVNLPSIAIYDLSKLKQLNKIKCL